MHSFRSLIDVGGSSLARHLDRLRDTLDALGDRLRDALAQAVGQTIAEAVREAVHAVLAEGPTPAWPRTSDRLRDPPTHLWQEPVDPRWRDAVDDWAEDAVGEEPIPQATPCPPHSKSMDLRRALLVGCETAAWCLRRRAGRGLVLLALGVGLVAAVVVLAGGPVATAGLRVAGSALGLLGLADAARRGVAALVPFGLS